MKLSKKMKALPAIALLLVGAGHGATFCAAQSWAPTGKELLRAEFWADIEPVAGVGEEWPVTPGEARSRILAEAAWVFSGMIWGFDFRYTPYDKARAIGERFEIAPIQSLAPSALRLAPGARASPPDALYSFAEYRPDAGMVSLMGDYANDPWKGTQGIGKADMSLGVKGRRAAYEDALRAAVRSLLQGREPNKPRLATGRVVFDRPPTMAIIGGYYTAQVRARAMVTELIRYQVY
jgi:hypothetical protein